MASKVGSGPPPPPPAPVVAATATAGPGPAAAAAASPSPSPSLSSSAAPSLSVECCMCGDHGLARELFRCRSCHHRYQHKYCSDLYPKADSYRSCNWCLRDGGTPAAATTGLTAKSSAKHNHHHHSTATPSSAHHSPSSSNKDHHPHQPTADRANNNNSHSLSSSTSTADNNSTGSSAAGTGAAPATSPVKQLQRGGDYAAHLLAKPLKKIRPAALERSASEVIVRVRAAEEMGAPAAAVAARRVAGGRHAAVRGKIRRYKLLEEVSS